MAARFITINLAVCIIHVAANRSLVPSPRTPRSVGGWVGGVTRVWGKNIDSGNMLACSTQHASHVFGFVAVIKG